MTIGALVLGTLIVGCLALFVRLCVMTAAMTRMKREYMAEMADRIGEILSKRDEAEVARTQAVAALVKANWFCEESERIKNAHAIEVRSWTVN